VANGVVELDKAATGTLVVSQEGAEEILDELVEIGAVGNAAFVFGFLAELEEELVEGAEDGLVVGRGVV